MASARKVCRKRPTARSATRRSGNDVVTTTMVRVHLPGTRRAPTRAGKKATRKAAKPRRKAPRTRR